LVVSEEIEGTWPAYDLTRPNIVHMIKAIAPWAKSKSNKKCRNIAVPMPRIKYAVRLWVLSLLFRPVLKQMTKKAAQRVKNGNLQEIVMYVFCIVTVTLSI